MIRDELQRIIEADGIEAAMLRDLGVTEVDSLDLVDNTEFAEGLCEALTDGRQVFFAAPHHNVHSFFYYLGANDYYIRARWGLLTVAWCDCDIPVRLDSLEELISA